MRVRKVLKVCHLRNIRDRLVLLLNCGTRTCWMNETEGHRVCVRSALLQSWYVLLSYEANDLLLHIY